MKDKIIVCMIVKNEEDVLDRCLKSLEGVDEIVICDTGSTDNTVEIAKKYTDKVYTDYEWNNNFAEARNHALSKCDEGWILSFDADDVLKTPVSEIREVINNNKDKNAITCVFKSGISEHTFPTMFYNKHIKWAGAAHNYLVGINRIGYSNILIERGNSPTHQKNPNRTLNILFKEVEKNPEKPRELYYLARELYYKKRYKEAIQYFDKYLKIGYWKPEIADAYLLKARCLWNSMKGQEARDTCMKAIQTNPDFKEALRFMSHIHYEPMKTQWRKFSEIAENKDVLFIRRKGLYDLNIFINCTKDGVDLNIGVFKKCLQSFKQIFGDNYNELKIYIDPNPVREELQQHIDRLKQHTNNIYVMNGLAEGYNKSVKDSKVDYCFQLEFDWLFENIKHSMNQLINIMRKENLHNLRFNKRQNKVGGWDTQLKEFHCNGFKYMQSNNNSNNPHIIDRKKYLKIIDDFDYSKTGSKGVEEVLNEKGYKSYIYGGFEYPRTIIHMGHNKKDYFSNPDDNK